MYDTRWPRPGPATAAVCAVVGLLVGIALGLSSGAGQRAEAVGSSGTTPPATTLPSRFYTVVLGSFNERGNAVAARASFRDQGVRDAAILSQSDYSSLGTAYAVSSGQFDDRAEADA